MTKMPRNKFDRANLRKLLSILSAQPKGKIRNVESVEMVLKSVWHLFEGSYDNAMAAQKLGRMENLEWNPPILSFVIERHGGTVFESTRAELQRWNFDLEQLTARSSKDAGFRIVSPVANTVITKAEIDRLALELILLIESNSNDERLQWTDQNNVRVILSKVFRDGVKQTVRDRQKRLKQALQSKLTSWEFAEPNKFTRQNSHK